MENIVKRYFWLVNLLVLGVMAWLSARVVNNVLAGEVASLPTGGAKAKGDKPEKITARGASDATRGLGWADEVVARNLFNSDPPSDEPVVSTTDDPDGEEEKKDPGALPGPLDDCEESKSRLTVKGTLMAEPAEWSLAIIEDGENRTDRLARLGEDLGEVSIAAIYRARVVLNNGGSYECLDLGKGSKKSSKRGGGKGRNTTRRPSTGISKNDSEAIKGGVSKVGDHSYEIDREMLDEQLEDLNKLARQARVIPHYRDGKAQGFKLVGVRPGSLYSHIGVRSGDILKGVNGEEINSPNKALELFERLKSTDNVNLDLERRGKKITMEYNIK